MGDYENTMTGFMNAVTDDDSLAREWANRLNINGTDRWMNEATSGRLLSGLRTRRFRDMVAIAMLTGEADPNAWRTTATAPLALDHLTRDILHNPEWRPDLRRLSNAVSDLSWLATAFPDKADMHAIYGLDALAAWLIGDMGEASRMSAAGIALGAGDEYATVIDWMLRRRIAPAYVNVERWPEPGDPDPTALFATAPTERLAAVAGVDMGDIEDGLRRFEEGLRRGAHMFLMLHAPRVA